MIEDLNAELLIYKSKIESGIKLKERKIELEAMQNDYDLLKDTIFQVPIYFKILVINFLFNKEQFILYFIAE